MIQRSSRATSLLGSSLNSSQLSLYSHASSRSGGGDGLGRAARVSSGGQASKGVSGHGYLTSSRTVSAPRGSQSKSQNGAISRARERRKQERRRAHTVAADEESPDGSSETGSKNDDLESYLMSFGGGEKAGRLAEPKATATRKSGAQMGHGSQRKHGLPRGSELDWDKLLELGGELMMNEMQSEDDDVFCETEDPGSDGGLDGSTFLKRPTTKVDPANPAGPGIGEQTKEKSRRISNVSSDIKFLGENSLSPSVSDMVLTDSLDTLTSSTDTPVATGHGQPRQTHTRNLLSDSERNALNDVKEATEIDADTARPLGRSKPVAMRTRGATPDDSHIILSEERSISESFDFKPNVLTSIDQLEADINELHHQSDDESSFEQNLHDVHSLQELEDLLDNSPKHSGNNTKKSSTKRGKSENGLAHKSPTSTKQEHSPSQPKPRLSSFKFSAASTMAEVVPDKKDKVGVSYVYSSDEFESESVSEVAESVVAETNGSVKEESVISHTIGSDREVTETVASGDSDDVRTEETYSDIDIMQYSELNNSGFSEAEQMDKSGRASFEHVHTSIRYPQHTLFWTLHLSKCRYCIWGRGTHNFRA